MRKLVWTAAAVLFLSTGARAQGGFGGGGQQGQDDHDDTAPVQAGYVVVTPSSPSASGLAVMETFGLRRGTETLQAGMPAPDLTTSATMFVDVSSRLAKNLGVAVVNPNSTTASVTFTLHKNDGTLLASKTVAVEGRRQLSQFVTELLPNQSSGGLFGSFGGTTSALTEYSGVLSISSTLPVSLVGLRFRGANFSTMALNAAPVGTNLPVLSLGVGGIGAFLLPQLAAGGGWATEIVVSNTGSSSVTVRVDLFKPDGTPLITALNGQRASSFTNLTIPAGGVLVLAPRDANGDDRF